MPPDLSGGPSLGRSLASIGVGLLPGVGTAQSLLELISGRDYIAGEKTSRWMAAAGLFAGLVPGGKGLLKALSKADDIADLAKVGRGTPTVRVPSSRYPETAGHIRDAQAAGHPSTLTIDRSGATGRRGEALAGQERVPGRQLDEYPPAMFKEGGAGASVRPVSPADNMGAGACIGNQCRGLPNGTRVRIVVE
jgi:hypothetical protein